MKYIKVQNMARYYLAAKMIKEYHFSLSSQCDRFSIKSVRGVGCFLNNYLKEEDPELYAEVRSVLDSHLHNRNNSIAKPSEEFNKFLCRHAFNEDSILDELCDQVIQWKYYEERPYALEKYYKECGA